MKIDFKRRELKIGDVVACQSCDIELYMMTQVPLNGDVIKAGYFKSINPEFKSPTDNKRFVCPKCKASLYGLGGISIKVG